MIAFSVLANVVVSTVLARRARETDSPALEGDAAHLRTDAATSAAVLVGLVLVELTGAAWLDPVIALAVAAAIVYAGIKLLLRASRVLVDEALPPQELDAVRAAIEQFGPRGVCGYHKLRARRAGSRRYVDLHVQFVAGTTLEDAHDDGTPPAGRDPRARARGRRADPPRARGQRASRHRAASALRSGEVDRRAQPDGDRQRAVAVVAREKQQQRGDQRCGDRHEPRDPVQGHARILPDRQ